MKEEKELDLVGILCKIWRNRRRIVKWGLIGLVTGLVISFSIPKEYTSELKMVSESKSTTSMGSMSGLASMMGVNVGGATKDGITEALYPEIFKSTPFLLEFSGIEVPYKGGVITLSEYLLDKQQRAWWSYVLNAPNIVIGWMSGGDRQIDYAHITANQGLAEAFVGTLGSRIKIAEDKKGGVLNITATMQSAEVSKIVTDSLFAKLIRYVIHYKTGKARDNLGTSVKMFRDARARYYQADSIYANMEDRNNNLISKAALARIARYKNERDLAYTVYQQLATQVEMDAIKLQEETPIATIIEPARKPLVESAPKKKLITFAFAFLFALGYGAVVFVQGVLRKE